MPTAPQNTTPVQNMQSPGKKPGGFIAPPKIPLSLMFQRFIVGFGSGFIGTITMGIILLSAWSIVKDPLTGSGIMEASADLGLDVSPQETHPLFLSILVLSVFLANINSNLIYGFLMTATEDCFKHRSTVLTQLFFGNLIILVLLLPLYLLSNGLYASSGVEMAAVAHCLISALFSLIVLEVINDSEYFLIHAYGGILGIILFLLCGEMLLQINPTIAFFLALPLLLGSIGLGNSIMEGIYSWMYRTYGVDMFRNTNREFERQ